MIRKNLQTQQDAIYLALLITIKAILQLYLYRQGFISVAADEFARGLQAAQWAIHPTFSLTADLQSVWLPFEKYLNGFLLWLWPDPIWGPRLTVFLASCLLLVVLFALVRLLFKPPLIAYLAVLFVAFQPWVVWLSGTPMLEMYYLPFFLAGIFFVVRWLQTGIGRGWLWGGLCFMVASGFHVQSWTFINLVNLLTVGFWLKFGWRRENGRFRQLTTFYLLGNSYIALYALTEYLTTGKLFVFLQNHTTYSLIYYQGYEVPLLEKLLYYPRLILVNTSMAVWFLLGIALVFLLFDAERWWKLFLLAVGGLALGLNSTLNALSGPPSAAPDRYAVFYILLLSPYLAYGYYQLITWSQKHLKSWLVYPLPIAGAALLAYSIWWGGQRIQQFPPAMPIASVKTGQYINELLKTAESPAAYMLELKYWDYIAVQLAAGHYETQFFDREQDFYNRNTPSIFGESSDIVLNTLTQNHIRYVALYDDALREKALQTGFLFPQQEIGEWTIFKFEP